MLIGILGNAGAGKDTLANEICSIVKFPKYSFAGPIKDIVNSLFGWDVRHAEGHLKDSKVELGEPNLRLFYYKLGWYNLPHEIYHVPTHRAYLSLLNQFYEPVGTPRRAYQLFGTELGRRLIGSDVWINLAPSTAVIADVRYNNEADHIRSQGGVLIRIEGDHRSEEIPEHSSEKDVATIPADFMVHNYYSKEHLRKEAERICAAIKLMRPEVGLAH